MRTRPERPPLQKTMVVVEGVARTLDRRMPTPPSGCTRLDTATLDRSGRISKTSPAGRWRSVNSCAVPGLLNGAGRLADQLDVATRDGLLLAPETVAAIGKRRRRGATAAMLSRCG